MSARKELHFRKHDWTKCTMFYFLINIAIPAFSYGFLQSLELFCSHVPPRLKSVSSTSVYYRSISSLDFLQFLHTPCWSIDYSCSLCFSALLHVPKVHLTSSDPITVPPHPHVPLGFARCPHMPYISWHFPMFPSFLDFPICSVYLNTSPCLQN